MKKDSISIVCVAVLLSLYGSAYATVWYVHPDSALNSIQAGLDSCADNDTVLVGPGTYYGFLWPSTQGIDLISQYGPDTTVIDGQYDIVILIDTGVDSTTIIHGFTIKNGHTSFWGGGIYCLNSSPTIANNIITENEAGMGGGIACDSAAPTIINNTITMNIASTGGGIWCYKSSPIIMDNTISTNTTWVAGGGGIKCVFHSSPTIIGNTVTGNLAGDDSGGGISCITHCSPTIRNNVITDNTADGQGSGIFCRLASPTIDSCTISGNNGDGVYCQDSSRPIISNNNITNNTGYGVQNVDSSVWVDAQYNWWGDPSGPSGVGPGTGDSVSQWVDYIPWLQEPVGIEEHKSLQPLSTVLQINPNPFCDILNITFRIEQRAESIQLKIYDATGRFVKDFSITPDALHNTLSWDGRDDHNRKLPSGIYFLKVSSGDHSATKKLLLIR